MITSPCFRFFYINTSSISDAHCERILRPVYQRCAPMTLSADLSRTTTTSSLDRAFKGRGVFPLLRWTFLFCQFVHQPTALQADKKTNVISKSKSSKFIDIRDVGLVNQLTTFSGMYSLKRIFVHGVHSGSHVSESEWVSASVVYRWNFHLLCQ